MTDKEIILNQHRSYINELNKIDTSKELLTRAEWEQQEEKRKNILVQLDFLKAIENSWIENTAATVTEDRVKMLTRDEVAEILNVPAAKVTTFCEIGMLAPTRTGRNFMFSIDDIYNFQKSYKGKDISSYEKALIAYNEIKNQS